MNFNLSDMTKMTIIIVTLMVLFTVFYIFLNRHTFFGRAEEVEQEKAEVKEKGPSLWQRIVYLFKGKPPIDYNEPLPSAPGKSYNYSYVARLTLAPDESLARYNKLKNHILSYANVVSSYTWKEETFLYRGKIVLKLRLQGQTMRLYLALPLADLKETDYRVTDVSHYKEHEQTNIYIRIRREKDLSDALALIDLSFLNQNIAKGMLPVGSEDFSLPRKKRVTLLSEGLIKEVDAPISFSGQEDEEEQDEVS
ncbi:MAG TPA: hypothetical protein VFD05_00040 [Bacilli bacterium]|nr:hypothetical protein [Bacilli bacterium]